MSESSEALWLGQLYEKHARELVGYAIRRTASTEDAADVVSETFLVAWRRREEVPAGIDARFWLYGVARRVLFNQHRARSRRRGLTDRLHSQTALIPLDATERSATAIVVAEALERLDEDDRELLRLTSWEGLAPTEIALAFGMPAATVRTRLHRARNRLRDELGYLGYDELAANEDTTTHLHDNVKSCVARTKE